MVSNADTSLVRSLYSSFIFNSLSVTRFVSCLKKRVRVDELVITNYRIE